MGVVLAALVTACNGSSTTSTTIPVPTPTPTAVATALTTTAPVPTSAGSITLPTLSGFTSSFIVGAGAPAGVTVTATESLSAPANAPAPSALRRMEALTGATNFFYVTLTFSQTIASSYFTGENLTVPSTLPTTAQYYVEVDDTTASPATKIATFGPVTLANLVAQFTNNANNGSNTPTLTTGHTYLFQFYYLPAGSATPTPSPSPTASSTTPTPTPTPSPSPSTGSTPTPSPTPSSIATVTPTPSPTPTADFTFTGAQATATLSASGGPLSVGPYLGVTLATTWGSNNQSQTTLNAGLAINQNNDITPTTSASFPPNANNGHVVMYLRLSANPEVTFAQTPAITLTVNSPSSFGGTTCEIYSLNGSTAQNATWDPVIGPVSPSGNQVSFPPVTLPASKSVDIGNPNTGGATFLSFNCS